MELRPDEADPVALAILEGLTTAMNAAIERHGPIPPRVLASALRHLADEFERMGNRRSL